MALVFKSGTNNFHGSLDRRYIWKKLVHRDYLTQAPLLQNWSRELGIPNVSANRFPVFGIPTTWFQTSRLMATLGIRRRARGWRKFFVGGQFHVDQGKAHVQDGLRTDPHSV
jgi:hypothetical protein